MGGSAGAPDTRQLEAVPGPGSGGGGGGSQKAKVPAPPAPTPDARVRLADLATPPIIGDASGSDAPGWLLSVLLGLGAVAALVALARVRGSSPERITRPLRASFADAGGRTADAFAQLRDSVRLGR